MESVILKAVSEYGSLAIVALVVAWLLTRTIPALMVRLKEQQTEFNAMLESQREAFISELNRVRVEHRAERKEDRAEFHRVLQEHTEAIRGLTSGVERHTPNRNG